MRTSLPYLAALAVLAAPAVGWAQDDDWELQEDAAQKRTVAAARYEGGQTIALQCEDGRLRLVVIGLPQSEAQLHITATRADGRRVEQVWAPIAPGVYRSAMPGRDARFLRGGGAFVMRANSHSSTAVSADFDLPSQSANLDRVLTDCGWALEDDRDLLEEAYVAYLGPDSRTRARPGERYYRVAANPEREVSCIIREMRLYECRADHSPSARTSHVRSVLSALRGEQLKVDPAVDPSDLEGKVYRAIASNSLLTVVYR